MRFFHAHNKYVVVEWTKTQTLLSGSGNEIILAP